MAAPGENMPADVRNFVSSYSGFQILPDSKRVLCTLTGHELPYHLPSLQTYVKGKKYQNLVSGLKTEDNFDYKKFEPHIRPNDKPKRQHELFCTLTLRHLNKLPSAVYRHVNGRRYKKALERWEECQRTGEKFVPLCKLNRKKKESLDHSSAEKKFSKSQDTDSESEEDSDDSMSDLYPAKYFEADDSDYDMEVDGAENTDNTQTAVGKRKHQEASVPQKRMRVNQKSTTSRNTGGKNRGKGAKRNR
ncbi:SURF2 [Branchiostoma lanceolatum]|uniref:SURF2 protein n=1 Tax=Branchiostoma lanceolatum TaxID=7740 RepID=A0A8K0ABV2_BRALA|nr:SURF2 [Branchiostoma lanceolatum]